MYVNIEPGFISSPRFQNNISIYMPVEQKFLVIKKPEMAE